MALPSLRVEVGALLAKRFAACALPAVLLLDVVAGVAVRVVVVDIRKNRIPRRRLGHQSSFGYLEHIA
jgi:hypothetical protein